MKPNTKYSQFLHDLYTLSAQPGAARAAEFVHRALRRIVCATPVRTCAVLTPETEDPAVRGDCAFYLCGRPRPGRRVCLYGFADGSVVVHIHRAVRFENGMRAVLFNRFGLRSEAGQMLGDMLLSPEMNALRSNAAK